jgi:hypothetical protein
VLPTDIVEAPLTEPRQGPIRTVIPVRQHPIAPVQVALFLASVAERSLRVDNSFKR